MADKDKPVPEAQARRVLADFRSWFRSAPDARVVHAHGIVLRGTFTAAPVAGRLTRAAHMQGQPVPVLARFSGSSGFPRWPDFLPDARGLAVGFLVPAEGRTDIVAASLPRFPLRRPEEVVALLDALRPSPLLPWRLSRFLLRHPGVLRGLPANLLALLRLPASYGSIGYHAIHAFTWVTPYGSERHVRYHWVPEQQRFLSWPRAAWRGPRYLEDELRQRLGRGAVRLHLQLEVARRGDPIDDPAAVWPGGRDRITVGTLELASIDEDPPVLAFDPLRLVDGIQASPDPVLHFRRQVYALAAAGRQPEAVVAEEGRPADAAPASRLHH